MDSVVIAGLGMVTAVGVTAAETAASVRSSTARFMESAFHDKNFAPLTLATVPNSALPPLADALRSASNLTVREERLLRLATGALRECAARVDNAVALPGLCLALPEHQTTKPLDGAKMLSCLRAQVGPLFHPSGSDASHVGRAGGLAAIDQAVLTIASGQVDCMIAGGVDTYRDAYVLGMLDIEERVKSEENRDGFIPGEGACFLLLLSARSAAARGLTPLASVSRAARGLEEGHLYSDAPYRGDGLATTVQNLTAVTKARPLAEVYSSMTGESHWAKEWGVTFIRNTSSFDPAVAMHHPADCYGDTGAAAGPLMVGLAALGIHGGYRRSPALVYTSSDRGARSAIVVDT